VPDAARPVGFVPPEGLLFLTTNLAWPFAVRAARSFWPPERRAVAASERSGGRRLKVGDA